MKRIAYLLFILVLMAGCKSSKHSISKLPTEIETPEYLSSKLQIALPNTSMNINGTMKMKVGERIQLSVLMPVFRSELYRIELTPTEVLILDRPSKQYVITTPEELAKVSSRHITYKQIEKLLIDASLPDGKKVLSTTDLGFPDLAGARITLSDFSNAALNLDASSASDKYKQVSLMDFISSQLGR